MVMKRLESLCFWVDYFMWTWNYVVVIDAHLVKLGAHDNLPLDSQNKPFHR